MIDNNLTPLLVKLTNLTFHLQQISIGKAEDSEYQLVFAVNHID